MLPNNTVAGLTHCRRRINRLSRSLVQAGERASWVRIRSRLETSRKPTLSLDAIASADAGGCAAPDCVE